MIHMAEQCDNTKTIEMIGLGLIIGGAITYLLLSLTHQMQLFNYQMQLYSYTQF
jgi:hypothetical protein